MILNCFTWYSFQLDVVCLCLWDLPKKHILNLMMISFSFVRSFFFGDTSSKRDPKAYLSYISALYDHYRKVYCKSNNNDNPNKTELPLVVNTPGWVKGTVLIIGQNFLVRLQYYQVSIYLVSFHWLDFLSCNLVLLESKGFEWMFFLSSRV